VAIDWGAMSVAVKPGSTGAVGAGICWGAICGAVRAGSGAGAGVGMGTANAELVGAAMPADGGAIRVEVYAGSAGA